LLERAVNQEFDGKVIVYPHIDLDGPIETEGKWNGEKEEDLFDRMLKD